MKKGFSWAHCSCIYFWSKVELFKIYSCGENPPFHPLNVPFCHLHINLAGLLGFYWITKVLFKLISLIVYKRGPQTILHGCYAILHPYFVVDKSDFFYLGSNIPYMLDFSWRLFCGCFFFFTPSQLCQIVIKNTHEFFIVHVISQGNIQH